MPREKLSSVVSDKHCCERHKTINDAPGECVECLKQLIVKASGAITYLKDTLEFGIEEDEPGGAASSVDAWKSDTAKWLADETVQAVLHRKKSV